MITEIPDCQLLMPQLLALLPVLHKITVLVASRKSELRFTVTHSEAGADIDVRHAPTPDAPMQMQLAVLAAQSGIARLVWNGEPVAEICPPYQRFADCRVTPPAGAFLQATAQGEQALVSAVMRRLSGVGSVLDLFAGCGTFSLPAARFARVHAVEGSAQMMAALEQGWRCGSGLKQLTTEARDLFRQPLLPDELAAYDAVIIDPPRAGAERQFEQIALARPKIVAVVSCNPVSFARDAAILLNAGYQMAEIEVVDQFRWSTHVELATCFTLQ